MQALLHPNIRGLKGILIRFPIKLSDLFGKHIPSMGP